MLGHIATFAPTRCDRLQRVQMLRSPRCSCSLEMVGAQGPYRARGVYAGESPRVRLQIVCISATPGLVSATSGITAKAAGPAAQFGGEEASSPPVSKQVGIGDEGLGHVSPSVSQGAGADASGATRGGVGGGVIRKGGRGVAMWPARVEFGKSRRELVTRPFRKTTATAAGRWLGRRRSQCRNDGR